MKKFFSKPFFKKWLKIASSSTQDWLKKENEYLKDNVASGTVVLDVGCGFGRHLQLLAGFCREVVGIDNNNEMFRKAKMNIAGLKNAKVFLQDAKQIDFPGNYFDYVVCLNNTFGNFVTSKPRILREMKRVCRRGGQLIVSVYNQNALDVRKTDYQKAGLHIVKIKDGIIYAKEGLVPEQFSKDQLKKIFSAAGLKASVKKLNPISYICVAIK